MLAKEIGQLFLNNVSFARVDDLLVGTGFFLEVGFVEHLSRLVVGAAFFMDGMNRDENTHIHVYLEKAV